MAMWVTFVQFVADDGLPVAELQRRTGMTSQEMRWWLTRMGKWWGYVVVEPEPTGDDAKPPLSKWIVRLTTGGKKAVEAWRPLSADIETRWHGRFGRRQIEQLRAVLCEVVGQLDARLPDSLPILGYGLFSKSPDRRRRDSAESETNSISSLPLPALLSRALLAFSLEYEGESDVSLAIGANVLRVLDEKGVGVQSLPRLAGVSKEAIDMAMGILQKNRLVSVDSTPSGSRTKIARLTPKGREAQHSYRQLLRDVEARWRSRFGNATINRLRKSLERTVGDGTAKGSPFFRGLTPHPDGWRASVPQSDSLPHYPMLLHRGGYPDGS
jgi:DNA-binding MarR family transcriptional regulator